ncbi:MAG: hydrolase, partial [Clostridia bacterium]|nr:hydrolase [Clostridia bacterium]
QEWTFVDAESLPFIYSGEKSVCTILPDGYTRWFKSGEAGGKKINAKINGNGMFALYDASGKNIYSSLRDSFEITIPENGYIAFSGEIGTVFEITLA